MCLGDIMYVMTCWAMALRTTYSKMKYIKCIVWLLLSLLLVTAYYYHRVVILLDQIDIYIKYKYFVVNPRIFI